MESSKYLEIIDKKIKETQKELDNVVKDLQNVHGVKPRNAEEVGKLLVIKDRVLFFKSALMTLQDIRKQIENVK